MLYTIIGNWRGEISKPRELREHIEGYYKKLFGREEIGGLKLEENFWEGEGTLAGQEAEDLIKSFSEQEIKIALDDMRQIQHQVQMVCL
jgi:hypothetical protein